MANMQSLELTYPKASCDLWRKRVMHWTSWVAWAIFVLTAYNLSLGPRSWVFLLGCALLAIFMSFTYKRLAAFACPRCKKRFFLAVASVPVFCQNQCYHCGLPKYDASQESSDPI